MTRNS